MVPFFIVVAIYLGSAIISSPLGSYIVNDEWIFFRQVEAFIDGIFRINSIIDPTFILQGLLGFIWSKLFGFSFENLHILSVLFSILFLFGLFKVLKRLKVDPKVQLAVLLVTIFNPILYHLSFTFMTEIYFLAFLIWALYFYLRYFDKASLWILFIAGVLTATAVLIRQPAAVLLFSFILILFIKGEKRKLHFVVPSLPVLLSIVVYLVWPRYSLEDFGLFEKLTNLGDFQRSLPLYLFSAFYLTFFVSPLILKTKLKINKALILLILIFSLVIYKWDVFPLGNILVLEGILAENEPIFYLSLLNNPVFKIFISLFISISLFKLLKFLPKKLDLINKFLILNFGLFFLLNLLIGDYFDRYLLIPFLFLIVYLARKIKFENISWAAVVFIIVFSLVLQNDYLNKVKTRWNHAFRLQEETGKLVTIGVDPAYGKYYKSKKIKDYSGFVYPNPTECCSCVVKQYPVYLEDPPNNAVIIYLQKINPGIRGEMPKEINENRKDAVGNAENVLFKDVSTSVNSAVFGNFRETVSYCRKN